MNLLPLLSSEHGPLHIIENFPLFSIILAFIGVVIASLTSRRVAMGNYINNWSNCSSFKYNINISYA